MKRRCAAAILAFAAAAPTVPKAESPSGGYAPMAYFAGIDGKTFSAQWKDENGTYTDVAKYELILGGRAVESTHRIRENGYGGRTIVFYDEAAKRYVYHYFTNAGFHTQGVADIKDGAMTAVETVSGHATIAAVRSVARFAPDGISVRVVYVGKDGKETAAAPRDYKPVADPGPLFPR